MMVYKELSNKDVNKKKVDYWLRKTQKRYSFAWMTQKPLNKQENMIAYQR